MGAKINSLAWWNDYFVNQWESYDGREQTRHFLTELVNRLPAREHSWLSLQPRTVLDWGCALGDGVDVLRTSFPKCEVTGLDFSRTAIEKAEALYPNHRFLLAEGGAIASDYDVIITSNCLEHYSEPFSLAAEHVLRARFLYIAMVPFLETEPMHESHAFRFGYESFPEELGDFRKLSLTIFRPLPRYWPGAQAIVCYGSPDYRPDARIAGKPFALASLVSAFRRTR